MALDDIVRIDLEQSKHMYEHYRKIFSSKGKAFEIEHGLSVDDNLDRLAVFALHGNNTLGVYYSYKPIFLELVSRWILRTEEIESQYIAQFGNIEGNNLEGLLVLRAVSLVIGVSKETSTLTELFLGRSDLFGAISEKIDSNGTIAKDVLEVFLVSYYRLLNSDKQKYIGFIKPGVLHLITNNYDSKHRNSKYLALIILSSFLNTSEVIQNKLVHKLTDVTEEYTLDYDDDSQIDLKFLPLVEAKRLSLFTTLNDYSAFCTKSSCFEVKPTSLSSLLTSICGILIPKAAIGPNEVSQLNCDYVHTQPSIKVLEDLAKSVQIGQPTLLYGKAGSGKTFLINKVAKHLNYQRSLVKIHLGEQTDAKLLLGTYVSGKTPGTFEWKSGVLTTAVREGRWVLIEDIDKAPTEVLSILLSLLENRELIIPSRGEVVKAGNGFQLISTIRTSSDGETNHLPELIGKRLWRSIEVKLPSDADLLRILTTKFPSLRKLCGSFIRMFKQVSQIYLSPSFITLNRGSHPRVISTRDLVNFCSRCNQMLEDEGALSSDLILESHIYDNIFAEAVDCFASALAERDTLLPVVKVIGEVLEIPYSRVNLFLENHTPQFADSEQTVRIGRAKLTKSSKDLFRQRKSNNSAAFARTNQSLRLMEQIGVSIQMMEPVLLVGETGTGKTTTVQQMAKLMNKRLVVLNVSQQTDSGDLIGGYKPINAKLLAVSLQEYFENIFSATFSLKKNERFSNTLSKCFNKNQWSNVIKLWKEACKMAYQLLNEENKEEVKLDEEDVPKKKRRLRQSDKNDLIKKWDSFQKSVSEFQLRSQSTKSSFIFDFVEGALVKAVRDGDWLLLDEINLASPDTLESIADLLSETAGERSILLTEKGDVESVKAHEEFRLFGCMNPSTDIGKKDLPMSIRSRFSEIYVHSPDKDMQDLMSIIERYIGRFSVGDDWVVNDIAELYTKAKSLAESSMLVDGANQNPHFSVRTLTRTLLYVGDIVMIYGLRRSLYEGFCMTFLTLLDIDSENALRPLIFDYTLGKTKNPKSIMNQCPAPPIEASEYIQFKHYWLKKGPSELIPQPDYIITPFVEKNLLNLVRATSSKRFPILIQGPTSSGKTSMIKYLANITGHKCVRINNHEHTDLQEYLGTYVSDSSGNLNFKEGILVEALKKGHWIILDELNLAPTDVLEALNRLLDDNRELFVPETQETVHPHPNFMLFATQNPPGLYGGRKILSRAFRNRFLELHYDDIPQSELEIILRDRCKIAPTYCKKIIEVYKELSLQRQSTRLFEQKNSFATLRDLFRWAMRDAVGYEELAMNGYMLLAERVRKNDEKELVKRCIEKVMRVKLDIQRLYQKLEEESLMKLPSSIVWTNSMRRLAVLVSTSIKYKEPLLLVGETGCGKTTICQLIADYMKKKLIVVNAHQNTETGDILGAQRPTRHRSEIQNKLCNCLLRFFHDCNVELSEHEKDLESMVRKYRDWNTSMNQKMTSSEEIENLIRENSILFEWKDGPLVDAMKGGDLFLLDEISLADDSVLERLNSVLETEKTLFLAEKGASDALIEAKTDFQFLATMNPGGDYGKKELSPALRNRFTEIWVPSMEDFDDVSLIVAAKLTPDAKSFVDPLVKFSEWFGKSVGGGHTNNGVISLRDILSWVQFINCASKSVPIEDSFLHGALMVFVDALGTNNTSFLADSTTRLDRMKNECLRKLDELSGINTSSISDKGLSIGISETTIKFGLFGLHCNPRRDAIKDFNLTAPTTASNAMKVVRAMQVNKPILLEGSPGVGKTSLISALAKATGNNLVRINLSEQTDLIDLFGSDAPMEGGKTGEFVWRDAPFLRAMKNGDWVLLDEMNLASQSVLEGLNACLDHRGVAYIPELDKEFSRSPGFTVFAAQNPQYQGGGRKGLPKSFVNRFSVVYVEALGKNDLNVISHYLFPAIDPSTSSKIIEFISALESEVVIKRNWGVLGGPWEFNLRDTLRWLELLSKRNLTDNVKAGEFLHMIACSRFRTTVDRENAQRLFQNIFGYRPQKDNYFNLGDKFVQANSAVLRREIRYYGSDFSDLKLLQCNIPYIETAFRCIQNSLPLILTGSTYSGKTSLVRYIAGIVGVKLVEFSMNNDIDSMDILGGYEQVDLTKATKELIDEIRKCLSHLTLDWLEEAGLEGTLEVARILEFIEFIDKEEFDAKNFVRFHSYFATYMNSYHTPVLDILFQRSLNLLTRINKIDSVTFEWFDGLLVKAVQNGFWLVLDNANLCNPAVLDRLNSLLETNGTLVINECSNEIGEPRVLIPHPNFRLFFTMNPKYGELSRAMRNRGVELYLEPLSERMTEQDRLYFHNVPRIPEDDLESRIVRLNVNDSTFKPLSNFIPSNISSLRPFTAVQEFMINQKENLYAESVASVSSFLQFVTISNLPRWKFTLDSCDIFSDQERSVSTGILNSIKYLNDARFLTSLFESYKTISETVKVLSEVNVDYSSFQSLHPYFNLSITPSLPFDKCDKVYSESSLLFIVTGALLKQYEVLQSIDNDALNLKVNQLSFLKLSAAYELGREVKKAPRFPIYHLVKGLNSFMTTMFEESTVNLFATKDLYKSIYDLHAIWICLVEISKLHDESKIRVINELLHSWVDSCTQNEGMVKYGVQLEKVLKPFESQLSLSTGLSMGKIWEKFRKTYPQNEKSWESIMRLRRLSEDFDEVAQRQFHDSFGLIRELRESVINVHNDILYQRISDDDLENYFVQFQSGLDNLNSISSRFLKSRRNSWRYQFQLLSTMVQSNGSKLISHDNIQVLELSTLSAMPTFSLVELYESEYLKPYPTVIKSLWEKEEVGHSLIPDVFSDKIIESGVCKADALYSTPGKFMEQEREDLKLFSMEAIKHSNALLADQVETFKELLFGWILELIESLTESSECDDIKAIFKNSNFNQSDVNLIIGLMKGSNDGHLANVYEEFIAPSLLILLKTSDMKNLGKSWILFSCGAIQLYVPNSPYDPAIHDHVLYDKFKQQQRLAQNVTDSWRAFRSVVSGDKSILAENVLNDALTISQPDTPEVYRSPTPVDILFEEWKSFMEASIDTEPIKALLEAAEDLSGKSSKILDIFQSNSSQFIERIRKNFFKFSDINDILEGYIYGLKLGTELMNCQDLLAINNSHMTKLCHLDVTQLVNKNSLLSIFSRVKEFCRTLSLDNDLAEKLMLHFIKIGHKHKSISCDPDLDTIFQDVLKMTYYRWTLRTMKSDEEERAKGSVFKYEDSEVDSEEDFKRMFPDYEEVMKLEDGSIDKRVDFDETYFKLCETYMETFLGESFSTFSELMDSGSKLAGDISSADIRANKINPSTFSILIQKLGSSYRASGKENLDFNFYVECSPKEHQNAITTVSALQNNLSPLLKQWPEHATLQNINTACSELLMQSSNVPLAKLIQKVEQIFTLLSEWEKYASSQVSLKTSCEAVISLIVSWRRLELTTWKSLFKNEEMMIEKSVGKWWFHLFETIIIPITDNNNDEISTTTLISALTVFMSQGLMGEFGVRLKLLRAFLNHVMHLNTSANLKNSLANFLSYFEQFERTIKQRVVDDRKQLEKEVSDIILFASWKDVNVDALKQSARKSHTNLYKVVRKYRSLLSSPVKPVIDSGLPLDGGEVIVPLNRKLDLLSLSIDYDKVIIQCKDISNWSTRPDTLKNIPLLEQNMINYSKRIENDEVPNLYLYSKDLLEEMDRLKKATPNAYNEKNKKLIATLKTQKRKLLSDCLKELRKSGLNTNTRADVHAQVQSSIHIMCNSESSKISKSEDVDYHFYKILDLLPRLKNAVGSLSEDIPQADAEKGLSIAENYIFELIKFKEPLFSLSSSLPEITAFCKSFQIISDTSGKGTLVKVSIKDSVASNLKSIKGMLYWTPKLLDFSISTLEATFLEGSKIPLNIFFEAKETLQKLNAELITIDSNVYSTSIIEFIKRFDLFYNQFRDGLIKWTYENNQFKFVADVLTDYFDKQNTDFYCYSTTSLQDIKTIEDVELSFRRLTSAILVSVQHVINQQVNEIDMESNNWMTIGHKKMVSLMKSLHYKSISRMMRETLECLSGVEYNHKTAQLASAICSLSLPIIERYAELVMSVLHKSKVAYRQSSHACFILSASLYNISTQGFCSPEEESEQKDNDNLQDGTGLGEGEGSNSNTNDIDEDDLNEKAQEPDENDKEKNDNDSEDDDVEMEGDMAGKTEDCSDQEEQDEDEETGEEDLDEERDEIDDLDPNAVDEKMWDEEVKENTKDKESDKVPENSSNDDDMEAKEDQEENSEAKDEKNDVKEEGDSNEEEENDDGEEKDVGEQEDEVRNGDNDSLDENISETEALELPEDMNLDDDEENKEDDQDDQEDDKLDDVNDEVDPENIEDVDDGDEEQQGSAIEEREDEGEEDDPAGEEEGGVEENESGEEDEEATNDESGIDDGENTMQEDLDSEEDILSEDANPNEESNEGNDKTGIESQGQFGDDDNLDMDASVKQESGTSGMGADNSAQEASEDVGGNGEERASIENEQQEQFTDSSESQREMARNSLKSLGDTLKEFHRRRQEIKESNPDSSNEENTAGSNPDEFEHINGENTDFDTQALGAADKDQIQSLDDDMAIDDETHEDDGIKQEEDADSNKDEQMPNEEQEANEQDEDMGEADFDSKASNALSGNQNFEVKEEMDDEDLVLIDDEHDMIDEEHFDGELKTTNQSKEFMTQDEARQLWMQSDRATQELSAGLCEQLRLILEPTLATKLRGDYKTGKRLNMKRIIPYIASDFRKDKIWLRRTKPSKRQYQIMIAVDDSKSMSESNSTGLAFNSIALVSKALSQLESGGISVVRFGEDIKLVHSFDQPFNAQESGPKIFQQFDFNQTRTNIRELCKESLEIFEDARSKSSSDLWQLQIILSDGVCEDHESILRLVRRAKEKKVMLVFVIIDGISSSESIMDMSQVSYVTDGNTGKVNLKVDKYLDTFPFEHYVVVKDISELPEMLSLILRQYFTEISSV